MLPASVKPALRAHLKVVKALHEKDVAQGYGRVYMLYTLAKLA